MQVPITWKVISRRHISIGSTRYGCHRTWTSRSNLLAPTHLYSLRVGEVSVMEANLRELLVHREQTLTLPYFPSHL